MMTTSTSLNNLRRLLLKAMGSAVVLSPWLSLSGCGGSEDSTSAANSSNDASDDTSNDDSADDTSSSDWATGGTAAMVVDFPDSSLFATSTACSLALTKALTEGPCYFQTSVLDDISEEQGGLPMQLCLQVIDSDCNPVSGLEVEVWHCDVEGIYSGDTSDSADADRFSSSFCTDNDKEALQAKWFRGIQVTDSDGRVNFKSCFPGWYSSRTIHIHFRIRNNNLDEVISQFCFTDSLTAEICTTHPEYEARGIQDTTLASGKDTVFGSSYSAFLFNTEKNSDGSLLAWKTIQIS